MILIKLKGLVAVLGNAFKDHQTLKLSIKLTALIKVITPSRSLLFEGGSISYVSDAYSGSATDRFITEDTNIAGRFTPGYSVLFDEVLMYRTYFYNTK